MREITPREAFENALDAQRNALDDAMTAEEVKQIALQRELDDMQDALIDLQEDCAKAIRERDEARAELARVKGLHEQLKDTVARRIAQSEATQ